MEVFSQARRRSRGLAAGALSGFIALGLLGAGQPGAGLVGAAQPGVRHDQPVPAAAAFATTDRFVSPTGSDAGLGSLRAPWRSVQYALDHAPATIYLRAGTYRGGLTIRRSGLVLSGFPGEVAAIRGGARDVVRFVGVTSGALRHLVVRDAPEVGGSGVLIASSRNVRIEDDVLRNNRSYGLRTWNSTQVRIAGNDVFGNDTGIQVSYAADGVVVADNLVHDNDRMIVNTANVYGDDHGAVGIVFLKTTGHSLASGNQVWGNRAASFDYGQDGGAFEVYGASDVTIRDNVAWDNKDVLETGTSGLPCARLQFVRNLAYGATSLRGWSRGLIVACASASLIANNTLDGFDVSAISVVQDPANLYLGSVDGLRVTNNILVSDGAPSITCRTSPGRSGSTETWSGTGPAGQSPGSTAGAPRRAGRPSGRGPDSSRRAATRTPNSARGRAPRIVCRLGRRPSTGACALPA